MLFLHNLRKYFKEFYVCAWSKKRNWINEYFLERVKLISGLMWFHYYLSCLYVEKLFGNCHDIGFLANSVTRLSTIVEILKFWSKIFSNKNQKNCILLHKFSLFFHNFVVFLNFFPTFSPKKYTISKMFWSHYLQIL